MPQRNAESSCEWQHKGKGLFLTAAGGRCDGDGQGRNCRGFLGHAAAWRYQKITTKIQKKANEHAGKGRYAIPMGMGHPGRPAQVTPAHPSRL